MKNLISQIISLDKSTIEWFSGIQNTFLNPIMIVLTKIWDLWIIWIILTFVLLLWKKYKQIGILLLLWLIVNIILWEWILKHIFMRERPFLNNSDIILKISTPITSSFPSWHTSASITFAMIFSYFFWSKSKITVITIWIIALWITISRLYLQVHYPSDIVWGMLIWIVSSAIVLSIYKMGLKLEK